jgi:cold shock CspA family protein
MSPKPFSTGTVQAWHSEEGWGLLVAPEIGTVFAHFSVLDLAGVPYRDLQEGQRVQFRYESPGQDGCDHRATYVKPLT